MTEPPQDAGPGQPDDGAGSSDPGSPDYNGSPEGAADDAPRRGAHRASARPTPPPPPPAGAPYWPTPPDAPPGDKLKQPLADTLPLRLLQIGGALIGVCALVFVLYLLFHHDTKSEDSTAVKATATATTPAGATTTPGGTTTAGAATTSGAASKPTTSKPTTGKPTGKPTTAKPTTVKPTTAKPTTAKPTTAKPTSKPAAQPTSKPTTAPPAADVKAPLLVLNNSRIHGLAVSGAATFRNGGWTVTGTGNYSGRLAQTTVFYAAGYRAAAETLARRFPSVSAVQARPAGVPGSAPLTVVLTRYFKP